MYSHRFAMAGFGRSGDDAHARAFEKNHLLDFYALGTRRGAKGISREHTRLAPVFGLFNYIFANTLPPYQAESLRFRLFGMFDRWVNSLLRPGQHFLVGYAFAPRSMQWIRAHGGKAFLDAWTSHPIEFWDVLTEEQRIWKSKYPPVSQYYQKLTIESVEAADYIFLSSSFVRRSFLKQGFDPERLLLCPYPVDLEVFRPTPEPRPADRPFTIIHTGGLSLRKGAPYLLEAFRLIRKEVPNAVLRVKPNPRDDVKEILRRYTDLPIEWTGNLDLPDHVRRYQTSDLLLFPSIEDGFAFVVAESLACGLPVITTPNTGASDLVRNGENGEVVPIRDAQALAQAALKWWERIQKGERISGFEELKQRLSVETFEKTLLGHLKKLDIQPGK